MKKFLLSACCLLMAVGSYAQEKPLWLRYTAISPDGTEIAFTYKGDIFKVSSQGGRAVQLTTHPAHDTQPVWSPDGQTIAFASNRKGGFDVYTMSARGGEATRITTHSADEYPIVFRNNEHILYSANIMPDAKDSKFPVMGQVYEVSTQGGRPSQFASMVMEDISFSPDGKQILYHDNKGYEDKWRKHHVSSIARDIWLCDLGEKMSFKKLTSFRGENRSPIWTEDGQGYYYLNEESGSFNLYKVNLDGSNKKQLTHFKDHPVRFLTRSNTGLMAFSYNGEIYTYREGEQPQLINVEIVADRHEPRIAPQTFYRGANELAVSPNGLEVAFIARGDVYVTSVEYGTTRQITDTPEQERSVSFSPDGRSLIYAAEREGSWDIYQTTLDKKDDKQFVYAQSFSEKQLTHSDKACFQPMYSPDGKKIAYLEDRTTRRVMDAKGKNDKVVLEGKYNYSYADGDQWVNWSPDGQWLITQYIGIGGWNSPDVALVKADGSGELTNLTQSGYSDSDARFVQEGKAMLWFSDRAGYRSHGSWGAYQDAYIMFFDREAYDKFSLSKEELALYNDETKTKKEKKKEEKEEKKKEEKAKKEKEEGTVKPEKVKKLELDLANSKDLVYRLTPNSSALGDAYLNNAGDKLYYLTRFEGNFDLWVHDLKTRSSRILSKGIGYGRLHPDKTGTHLFLVSGGQIKKVNIASGAVSGVSMSAPFNYRPAQEREYMFDHVWQQVKDKFYVTDLHGVDWEMYGKNYKRFLPHIDNNFDFAELLSELLGELNASHTGGRYYGGGSPRPVGVLGAFYDSSYKGEGIKIEEILPLGPLGGAKSKFKAGSIILKIDGEKIKKEEDFNTLLAGKVGKRVLITYKTKGSTQEEWIKPISQGAQQGLLYKRWVEQRRQMVEKLSKGKIGYVHIKGMNSDSFREVYSELLGRYRNADAVVVDTRFNGGGWLHDDLVTLLSGKVYQRFIPRGQFIGNDPFNKWTKPSAVLMSEANYSNAHGFPWLYKELGVGKLIGMPVPGTMTAVWWETLIDPSIVFGIPQVAIKDMRGDYLENQELFPDITVENDPASLLEGRDLQIERAVEHLLEVTGNK